MVGSNMVLVVQNFFSMSHLLGEVNATIISLIPKVPHLQTLSQFRVISCYIVIYKVITKILVNRLKMVILGLILPGISIGDNALLAQELIHQYHLHK